MTEEWGVVFRYERLKELAALCGFKIERENVTVRISASRLPYSDDMTIANYLTFAEAQAFFDGYMQHRLEMRNNESAKVPE